MGNEDSFVAREVKELMGTPFLEAIIKGIDWDYVVRQAIREHTNQHANKPLIICGNCIQAVLLRVAD